MNIRNAKLISTGGITQQKNIIPFYKKLWAAAVIIILLSGGAYFYFDKLTTTQKKVDTAKNLSKNFNGDIPPGGNKAILTLSDGSTITLDSAKNGTLTSQGNTKISKLNDGQLAYTPAGQNKDVVYNTVSTPRGGQYQITLADGTKVWLNAASSLKFPTTFEGKVRNVELYGEGYFEVAKNAAKPFKVKINDASVEVLGTHFNINSYSNEEAVKTTLLEGSVKVYNNNASIMLTPGQQAQIIKTGKILLNSNVDVSEIMAWKDGFFEFENMDLSAIMRQIERWYDVSVEYKHNYNNEKFGGRISRNLSLSNVLHLLETNGINIKLYENKIIIN